MQVFDASCHVQKSFKYPVTTFLHANCSCLPLASKEGDPCQVDEQCTVGSLGKYSHCSSWTSKCECHPLQRGQRVSYYDKTGKCYVERSYYDFCENADECRASLGKDAECDFEQKVCRRKQIGDFCNNNLDCAGLKESYCRKFERLTPSDNSGRLYAGECVQGPEGVTLSSTSINQVPAFSFLTVLIGVLSLLC